MLTPKQKAFLKSLANKVPATFQIGKEGLSENLLTDVLNYLNRHEIIKISVLQNATVLDEEIIAFFEQAHIEFVQKIGRQIILYKHSNNVKEPIVLPVKKSK